MSRQRWGISARREIMTDKERERRMVKFTLYLYKDCHKAKNEGWIYAANPKEKKGLKFDYLDQIPAKIRQHIKSVGLAYDVAAPSGKTVISTTRKHNSN
jgi:hypothetical protein